MDNWNVPWKVGCVTTVAGLFDVVALMCKVGSRGEVGNFNPTGLFDVSAITVNRLFSGPKRLTVASTGLVDFIS